MKALTLRQPWASLIALGHKTIETRSWRTHYRGPIAIHAAKTFSAYDKSAAVHFMGELKINKGDEWPTMNLKALPQGAIVATANLVDCVPSERLACEDVCFILGGRYDFQSAEWEYGNYEPGRWGWILEDIKPAHPPIAATGKQGLWNWEEPTND